jgi:tryptophan halogenase
MPIPESLQHRIDLFKQTGKVFQKAGDVFAENSWTQVMLGQGLMPEQYHSIVNMMSDDELRSFLENIKHNVDRLVEQLPSHQQFISNYCQAEAM